MAGFAGQDGCLEACDAGSKRAVWSLLWNQDSSGGHTKPKVRRAGALQGMRKGEVTDREKVAPSSPKFSH